MTARVSRYVRSWRATRTYVPHFLSERKFGFVRRKFHFSSEEKTFSFGQNFGLAQRWWNSPSWKSWATFRPVRKQDHARFCSLIGLLHRAWHLEISGWRFYYCVKRVTFAAWFRKGVHLSGLKGNLGESPRQSRCCELMRTFRAIPGSHCLCAKTGRLPQNGASQKTCHVFMNDRF